MGDARIIHVVGTGTIGEPLIGLLCHHREQLGFDEVTFHKRTPIITDRPKVRSLLQWGARLAVDEEARDGFVETGIEPELETREALERADVVIDCTPAGNANKETLYKEFEANTKGFIAQGSEFGFGKPYARGINDSALVHGEDRYIQVVSCNTHNLSVLCRIIGMDGPEEVCLREGRFVCIRRSNDISQDTKFVPSPLVDGHKDARFGTHHARDAARLFETMGADLNLFSSSLKLNTQYMHTVHFHLKLDRPLTRDELLARFERDDRVALTQKRSANVVFSFGRDHGHYGRILSQTVIVVPSLHVSDDGLEVTGYCFTPQDGNSILSSVAAAVWFYDPDGYQERIQCFSPLFFQEV